MKRFLDLFRKRPAPMPDWSAVQGYSELADLIGRTEFPSHQAFLDGPLERFLDMVEAHPGRAGARVMEFLTGSVRRYSRRLADRGEPVAALDAAIDRQVRARFASGTDNDAYMIEVFEGRSNHNFRGNPEDEED